MLVNKLRFTLYAWRKLCFIRDLGDTEVSFFAVSRRGDLGLVVDVRMPYQTGSAAYTEFAEDKLNDFFEEMVSDGYHPEEFGRIWCHTHPGMSANPSGKDEQTFKDEFAQTNWAVMFILGKGSNAQTTCRLKYMNHPDLAGVLGTHTSKELTVDIDLLADCPAINQEARDAWTAEYNERHTKHQWTQPTYGYNSGSGYNWNTQNNFQASPHYRGWRTEAAEKVFGPGWRKNKKGNWVFSLTVKEEDLKNNVTISPDFTNPENAGATPPSSPSSEQWRQRFRSDERKTPIGFYQPETSHRGKLTKRERKYLKKHGTLAGFVPPQRKIFPAVGDWDALDEQQWQKAQMIPMEKLETSRNLLTEQSDDEWLAEAADAYEMARDFPAEVDFPWDKLRISERYTVTLPDGQELEGVWARMPEEALYLVEKEMGIEFSEKVKAAIMGVTTDDEPTELELVKEPTDQELQQIEAEEANSTDIEVFAPGEVADGLQTYSEHELSAMANEFHSQMFDT